VLNRNVLESMMVAVGLIVGASMADAAAPVTLDGWRYIEGPDELHVYVCDRADCARGSKVICHRYPPGNSSALPPGALRRDEVAAAKMLGEEPPKRDTTTTGFSISLPMPKPVMRDVSTAPDGAKTYRATTIVESSRWQASLISLSGDAGASEANLDRFEAALKAAQK
jgi:hypothetical protein